jgi:hypothetical protein
MMMMNEVFSLSSGSHYVVASLLIDNTLARTHSLH